MQEKGRVLGAAPLGLGVRIDGVEFGTVCSLDIFAGLLSWTGGKDDSGSFPLVSSVSCKLLGFLGRTQGKTSQQSPVLESSPETVLRVEVGWGGGTFRFPRILHHHCRLSPRELGEAPTKRSMWFKKKCLNQSVKVFFKKWKR